MSAAQVETALITGASSGLGAEFARQLGATRTNLVLVARDAARLEAKAVRLRQEFGIDVQVLPADLLTDDGVAAVGARLADRAAPVSTLVNSAGHGLVTPFDRSTVAEELDHLRLLVTTPLQLSHAAIGPMLERGHGRIINVSSISAFIPRGTYGAAKAWILSFSRWANWQYASRGVHVTAVCPGFVHTEFHQRMRADMGRVPRWMWLDAERVVREALADSAAGKGVSVPTKRFKVLAALGRFAPTSWAAAAGNRGR
ncbi:SDR family NAD(P)-dependent oxidoreductase [Specibacter cremeus]|uniref:SDR family NAD(P)-dependent oxidoreductase n=1 Tax=Specibacter cremeus TaxID=1629051 RepID=UPI000F798B61|nr:SDR family NAD(P)-dependent oxidoreductase [Specibacter cremeus]